MGMRAHVIVAVTLHRLAIVEIDHQPGDST
jgi:hypothetical protein